jgi:hypothetical protein
VPPRSQSRTPPSARPGPAGDPVDAKGPTPTIVYPWQPGTSLRVPPGPFQTSSRGCAHASAVGDVDTIPLSVRDEAVRAFVAVGTVKRSAVCGQGRAPCSPQATGNAAYVCPSRPTIAPSRGAPPDTTIEGPRLTFEGESSDESAPTSCDGLPSSEHKKKRPDESGRFFYVPLVLVSRT